MNILVNVILKLDTIPSHVFPHSNLHMQPEVILSNIFSCTENIQFQNLIQSVNIFYDYILNINSSIFLCTDKEEGNVDFKT